MSLSALMELLFDPLARIRNANRAAEIRSALPAARSRWQAQGIAGYAIEVKGFVPLSGMLAARLRVRDNELAAVEVRQTPWDEQLPWEPLERQHWNLPFCSYAQLTVPSLFGKVEQALAEADLLVDALEVRFDPQYGFVTSYDYRSGYHQGFSDSAFSEGCLWYAFSHFHVVDGK